MTRREAHAEALWRAGTWLHCMTGEGAQSSGDNGNEEEERAVSVEILAIADRLIERADDLGFDYLETERLRAERFAGVQG